MTLKDLANKYQKSTKEISRILTRLGFRGIYKDSHSVPDTAIELVEVEIVNGENTLQSLPSANLNQPEEAPIQKETATPSNTEAIKSQLQQTSQAMIATADHIATERNQQLISNAEVLGITDAIGSNLAYKRAYADTLQQLAVLDANGQSELLVTLTSKLNNPDFFGTKTSQETYYATSQTTAKDTAKNLRSMVKNLSY